MRLSQALRITNNDIVAFVGGGGKTSAMFRLATEIVERGGRVITTTTTRIFAAQTSLAPRHFFLESADDLAPIRAALETEQHVLVTGPVERSIGKAFGLDPAFIPQLALLPGVSAVLIEADGSRMRPFKAPAEHEPVIPAETTVVVPVVGADVFGAALDDVRVHRPEWVSALAGAPLGSAVTPDIVARVLAHPQGGLKNVPPGARVIPFINKVGTEEELKMAREVADSAIRDSAIQSVMIGAVQNENPVREVWGRVGAVVLAAGRSTRMGRIKQILPWGAETMIGTVAQNLRAAGLQEIVVVTGAARAEVEAALTGQPVRFAFNPDFAVSEMARSLQTGLWALPENCSAVIVALADQPQIEPEVLRALLQRWRETQAPVVAPAFHGQRGNPLLLDRALWPELLGLPADANPRAALRAADPIELVPVETDSILRDIDTPDDYQRGYNPSHG